MGKQTIAEFVEDEHAAKLLTSLGVDYGQGFYLGRPTRLNDIQHNGRLAMVPPARNGRQPPAAVFRTVTNSSVGRTALEHSRRARGSRDPSAETTDSHGRGQ